jgi:hypothetical protein
MNVLEMNKTPEQQAAKAALKALDPKDPPDDRVPYSLTLAAVGASMVVEGEMGAAKWWEHISLEVLMLLNKLLMCSQELEERRMELGREIAPTESERQELDPRAMAVSMAERLAGYLMEEGTLPETPTWDPN